MVDNKTDTATIESTFDELIGRKDIAIVLINQHASLPSGTLGLLIIDGIQLTVIRCLLDRREDTPPY